MKVLAIDTSTEVRVGVADDGQVLARASIDESRQHVEQLTPLVARALADAGIGSRDLDLVVVGLGPGPFTGLRVGIVTAQVMAAMHGVALRGVCSLDAIAIQAADEGSLPQGAEFVVASDARRKELYWARYDHAGVRIDGPHVTGPDQLPDLPVVGPGADVYPQVRRGRAAVGPAQLDAGVLATAWGRIANAGTEPLYLRRPDATEPGKRKSALAGRGPRQRTRGAR